MAFEEFVKGFVDVTETTYVLKVWFVSWGEVDWMLVVFREKDDPEGRWRGVYRFAYRFSGQEERKSIYTIQFDAGSEEEAIKMMDDFAEVVASHSPHGRGELKALEIRGGAATFLEKMAAQDWVQVQSTAPPATEVN